MNRCADCKHWDGNRHADIGTPLDVERDGSAECRLLSADDRSQGGLVSGIFSHGVLYTMPDFGCALWEKRE